MALSSKMRFAGKAPAKAEQRFVTLRDLPDVQIKLHNNARARRYGLRVSRSGGAVTLTIPARGTEKDALEFALAHQDWLREAVARLPPVTRIRYGASILYEGTEVQLVPGQGRLPVQEGQMLFVPGPEDRMARKLESFLRHHARRRLQVATEQYAAQIGQSFSAITLRDTRSRWGSCSSKGALSYSWRLIMAPPEVLDYVAAHEVAHLVEMNHSPAFWAIVEKLRPDWRAERRWLRDEGGRLHATHFRD
ncbi:SprT family zinc-dependent metalloprotease [Thioclava litoralis]|uniref:SprT family zinc-dependent metalloprotease n=1 Tax=Thioclava litoralis TaxID=3076557 RepID=A0ABZ1DXV2_9RHOB|nr:SprT family zinc-dependent metalloprotease [Thioclava sp. FTW29]